MSKKRKPETTNNLLEEERNQTQPKNKRLKATQFTNDLNDQSTEDEKRDDILPTSNAISNSKFSIVNNNNLNLTHFASVDQSSIMQSNDNGGSMMINVINNKQQSITQQQYPSSSLFSLNQHQSPLPIWAERTLIFFKVFEQQCDILSTRKPVDLDNVQNQITMILKEVHSWPSEELTEHAYIRHVGKILSLMPEALDVELLRTKQGSALQRLRVNRKLVGGPSNNRYVSQQQPQLLTNNVISNHQQQQQNVSSTTTTTATSTASIPPQLTGHALLSSSSSGSWSNSQPLHHQPQSQPQQQHQQQQPSQQQSTQPIIQPQQFSSSQPVPHQHLRKTNNSITTNTQSNAAATTPEWKNFAANFKELETQERKRRQRSTDNVSSTHSRQNSASANVLLEPVRALPKVSYPLAASTSSAISASAIPPPITKSFLTQSSEQIDRESFMDVEDRFDVSSQRTGMPSTTSNATTLQPTPPQSAPHSPQTLAHSYNSSPPSSPLHIQQQQQQTPSSLDLNYTSKLRTESVSRIETLRNRLEQYVLNYYLDFLNRQPLPKIPIIPITDFDPMFDLQAVPEITGSAKLTQLILDASQRPNSPPRGARANYHTQNAAGLSPHKSTFKPNMTMNPKRLFPNSSSNNNNGGPGSPSSKLIGDV